MAYLVSIFYLLLVSSIWAQPYVVSTVAGGMPPPTPAVALKASIGLVSRVIAGSDGSVYFTSLHCVFKVDAGAMLTRIAGIARPGYAGDGGPATAAQLNTPNGIALDRAGNLYIADTLNSVIRRVSRDGVIVTYAGSSADFGGHGGTALKPQFLYPQDVAIDIAGNLFVADTENRRIRKVAASGIVSTIGGTGATGSTGDSGPAIAATISRPTGLAFDGAGNLYVADNGTRVRRIDPQGIISTVAGTGAAGFSGDGGAAIAARLAGAQAVAVDAAGNLLIADSGNRRIRRVTPGGEISTVAGNGDFTSSGDGGSAAAAGLARVAGIGVDSGGTMFMADLWKIRRVSAAGAITTFAGNGEYSFSGDGGQSTAAQLGGASGIATDANGNLYFADSGNNRIRKISRDGVISTIAGDGTIGDAGNGGAATSAQVVTRSFTGMAVDKNGNVYFGDFIQGTIRKIDSAGVITKFAGFGASGTIYPGIAIDASGNVYYVDGLLLQVRKATPAGAVVIVAGGGSGTGDGIAATGVVLSGPQGLALDAAGNLFISEVLGARIRKVTPAGIITTYAGTGVSGSSGDGGPATKAQLSGPGPLAIDSAGNLYVVDGNGVRVISPAGIISTFLNGSSEYSGDGGSLASMELGSVAGLAVDAAGNLFIADDAFAAVRKLQPGLVTGAPSIAAVTNAASNRRAPLAPGEIVVVYGSGLGPAELTGPRLDAAGLISTELAGTQVMVNGIAAPLIYTSATQVAAIMPFGVFDPARIAVGYQGAISTVLVQFVDRTSPALFTADSSGVGQAAAVNQNGSLNGPGAPAAVGSVIQLYATGEGITTPDGVDGKPAAMPFPVPVLAVTVSIGGKSARVLYAGGAPGATAGLMQVNVEIPSAAAGSAVPVLLQVGDSVSPSGVVIAVSEK